MGCRGLSRVQGGSVGCQGGLNGVPGGLEEYAAAGREGDTRLIYKPGAPPKNGRALCVSPALSPSLTPWPGCALGLVNPQRPGWGPPRWCELTRWPLDLCYPCVSPPDPLCPMCLAGAWPPLSLPQFPFPAGTGTLATPFPGKLVPASHWGCGGGSGHWPHATSQGCRQVRQ